MDRLTKRNEDGYQELRKMVQDGHLTVLPCAIGAHLWRITHPYRQQPKVTEYIVTNFRTVGKKHRLQLEVRVLGVPGTNWMRYKDFFATREQAEAALKGGAGA